MSWATHAKDALRRGNTVVVRPRGHSMRPKVCDGDRVTLEPVTSDSLVEVGDIVLVRVKGRDYLHLVKAIRGDTRKPPRASGTLYQIGNNKTGINGWVGIQAIYGKCIEVSK
jgi:hypothetical protein